MVDVEVTHETVRHLLFHIHVLQLAAFAFRAGYFPALVPALRMRRAGLTDFRWTFLELPTIHNAVVSDDALFDRS